ncbi:MAG: UDP-glucuronic acid decarboxylase family protein [Candidatus Nezhaarchaeales archaeon]
MSEDSIEEGVERVLSDLNLEELNGKRVLVTGGAGFLGSWMCDVLVRVKARVVCLDNLSGGRLENVNHLLGLEGFKFVMGDVCSFKSDERYDYILHLASRAAPEEYQRYPIDTLLANSLGSLNVLELARRNDATILLASTSEVYGDSEVVPTPEDYWGYVNPVGVRSCYDEGKRFAEALFMAYHRQYGLNTRIVRIFNTYGPRMRGDGFYARVIPRFVVQALRGEDLTVYGDGSQTRSFCYVSDTAAGMLLALLKPTAKGEVINIGSPWEISILELAKKVKEMVKSASNIVFKPLPPDDPKRRRPDVQKAKKLLGWEAKVRLEEGLARTVNWFKAHIGLGARGAHPR